MLRAVKRVRKFSVWENGKRVRMFFNKIFSGRLIKFEFVIDEGLVGKLKHP